MSKAAAAAEMASSPSRTESPIISRRKACFAVESEQPVPPSPEALSLLRSKVRRQTVADRGNLESPSGLKLHEPGGVLAASMTRRSAALRATTTTHDSARGAAATAAASSRSLQSFEELVRDLRMACKAEDTAAAVAFQDELSQSMKLLPSNHGSQRHFRTQLLVSVIAACHPTASETPASLVKCLTRLHGANCLLSAFNCMWSRELAGEKHGGQAAIGILNFVADEPEFKPILRDILRYNPQGLIKTCKIAIGDRFVVEKVRRQAALLIYKLSIGDTESERLVRNEDPCLLSLAERMVGKHLAGITDGVDNEGQTVHPDMIETTFQDGAMECQLPVIKQAARREQLLKRGVPGVAQAQLDEFADAVADFELKKLTLFDSSRLEVFIDCLMELLRLGAEAHQLHMLLQDAIPVLFTLMTNAKKQRKFELLSKALQGLAWACTSTNNNVFGQQVIAHFLENFSPADVDSDPPSGRAYADLMAAAVLQRRKEKGTGWGISEVDDGRKVAKMLRQLSDLSDLKDPRIKLTTAFLTAVMADPVGGMTLEMAFNHVQALPLTERVIPMGIVVNRLFHFVVETMEIYATTAETANSHQLREQAFGNQALRLLTQASPDNHACLLAAYVPQMLLDGIRCHTDLEVVQEFVLTAVEMSTASPAFAAALASHVDGPGVVAQAIIRAKTALTGRPMPEVEQICVPRLTLIRLMARDRQVFANTPIADYLIQLLDDCDEYYFGDIRFTTDEELDQLAQAQQQQLKNVIASERTTFEQPYWALRNPPAELLACQLPALETLRQVFCRNLQFCMVSRNIPRRVLGLILSETSHPALLPHALFLVGAMSVTPDIRAEYLKLSAIERILQVLQRVYPCKNPKAPYISEIVCNACMALASLVVEDEDAGRRFAASGGYALLVNLLPLRGQIGDFYGVNGACSLICNLCYRNDIARSELGSAGACEALVEALRGYRGPPPPHAAAVVANSKSSICLSSTFRALGNLALNSQNSERFLACEVAGALSSFLREADGHLEDETFEACFRTLSTLVVDMSAVSRFVPTTLPLLLLLRKLQRYQSATMYRWAYEAMGQLCRCPRSAKIFVANEGPTLILSSLQQLPETNEEVVSAALFALGTQTSEPTNGLQLIAAGTHLFAMQLLEQYRSQCQEYYKTCCTTAGPPAALSPSEFSSQMTGGASPGGGVSPSRRQVRSATLLSSTSPRNRLLTMRRRNSLEAASVSGLPSTLLPLAALRVVYRIVTSGGEQVCKAIVDAGVFKLVVDVFCSSWPRSMISFECLRVSFATLAGFSNEHCDPNINNGNLPSLSTHLKSSLMIGIVSDKSQATSDDGASLVDVASEARVGSGGRTKRNSLFSDGIFTRRHISPSAAGGRKVEIPRNEPAGAGGGRISATLASKAYHDYTGSLTPARNRIPKGVRAWQLAKLLESVEVEQLIEVTRRMLTSERNVNDGRLFALGMGLLCYFACEKTGFDALYKRLDDKDDLDGLYQRPRRTSILDNVTCEDSIMASPQQPPKRRTRMLSLFVKHREHSAVGGNPLFSETGMISDAPAPSSDADGDSTSVMSLILHTIRRFRKHKAIQETALLLLAHMVLCAVTADEIQAVTSSEFYNAVRSVHGDKTSSFAEEVITLYKAFLDGSSSADASSNLARKETLSLVDFEYPLALSEWFDNPYPFGPQSLAASQKTALREGGKLEIVGLDADGNVMKRKLIWKASHDLTRFCWKTVNQKSDETAVSTRLPNSLAVSTVRSIISGIGTPEFEAVRAHINVPPNNAITIIGPIAGEGAQLIAFHIVTKNTMERDQMVSLFSQWRDAAGYGFR